MKGFPILIAAMLAIFLFSSLLPSGVAGAAVVIDEMVYTPAEPAVGDEITVTAGIVLVDAEPRKDGVILAWSLCTESMCEFPNYETMSDNGDGTWSATIPEVPAENPSGEPYVEIKFHVEVTADPTDGGTGPIEEENDPVILEIEQGPTPGNDDDTADDDTEDDDSNDSPMGSVLTISSIAMGALLLLRKRRSH
ncbi:MAG: hypothetical protein R6V01_00140 [Thermoplasmatota archaeon]